MLEKIKVLQISKLYWPHIGGVEKVVQDIAEGMRDRVDIEVLVCIPKGKGKKLLINGVKVTMASSFGIYWGMPVSITFPFLLAWKSRKADILHFHLPFPLAIISYLLIASRQKKMIVTYHSDIVRQKKVLWLHEILLRKFLKKADKILVTSPNLLNFSKTLAPFKNKCIVVPLWIDQTKYGYSRQKIYNVGHSHEENIVLFVGRLTYYKGLEFLIEAMKWVNAKLIIIGDGSLRRKLESKARALGLEHKIIFAGRVSDEELKYYYQICDVFVLPSTEPSEAFGLVQLEAMAYGKPIVNTNLPTGVPFVSRNGETGLTVPPKNSKALAESINKILNDKELRQKFSKNALKRVCEFSKEKALEKIYAIYLSLIKKDSI